VRVALGGQPLEEIPAAPQRSHAERTDNDAAEEEWHCERRANLSRCKCKRERKRREREVLPLLLTQLAKACGRVYDSTCLHGKWDFPRMNRRRHPWLDRRSSRLFRRGLPLAIG
jgi:hypothetical protein